MPIHVTRPEEGIALLTLDRADRMNALDRDLVLDLTQALEQVRTDTSIRVVVLTGAGRAFCAGLDLGGYGDDDRVAEQGAMLGTYTRQQEIAHLTALLHELPQPVIAAVNGAAAGGGFALVCASDLRLASTSAKFAVGFIRAGYSACDIGVSWLLPRIVGVGRAHDLMLTGRAFEADEAREMGLVLAVVEPDDLLPRALAKARQVLGNAPVSVELTKVGMWQALETATLRGTIEFENRQQMVAAMTEDASEATRAFLEKRPPRFRRR